MQTIRVLVVGVLLALAACDNSEEELSAEDVGELEELAAVPLAGPSTDGALIALVGASIIDGTGGDVVPNGTVLVRGETVLAVGADVAIPDGAARRDVAGRWIVPGLIDAHVHFMTSGRSYTRPGFVDLTHLVSYEEEVNWIKARTPITLRRFLCSGVTSVVSMGGPEIEYTARGLADAMDDAPTVFNAHGVIAPVPEFLARQVFDPWDGELPIRPVRSEERARIEVAEAVRRDAMLIKTAVESGSGLFQNLLLGDFQPVHKELVETGSKFGLRVTSHVHALEPARSLIELGVSSLQHIPSDLPVDAAFLDLLIKEDAVVVPTLALRQRSFVDLFDQEFDLLPIETRCGDPEVIQSWADAGPLPPLQDPRHLNHRAQTRVAIANTKALYEGGARLAVGTDAGLMGLLHGPSMHLELQAMNDAGIPPKDLITAATLNGAIMAGTEEFYGSVEPGKFADFLILSANPLEDIANLQAIETVVKHGRVFAQTDLLPTAD